jgi:hypothetical protein
MLSDLHMNISDNPTVQAHTTHSPRVVNTQIDTLDAFDTNDLLIRHPDPNKSHLFKVFGRADDQIMLSTGEKVLVTILHPYCGPR